jgi:uncharacterized protein (UPF0548 family)
VPVTPAVTYPEVGQSLVDPLPSGYHHIAEQRVVGHGRAEYERAARELFRWAVHRRAGLRIITSTEQVVEGALITSILGIGRFGVHAPCIVVAVVDELDRVGWAYGTLPGHPECGEEAFLLTLLPSGEVLFEVRAFSRAGVWWSKVVGPAGRAVQRWVTTRYLRALVTARP